MATQIELVMGGFIVADVLAEVTGSGSQTRVSLTKSANTVLRVVNLPTQADPLRLKLLSDVSHEAVLPTTDPNRFVVLRDSKIVLSFETGKLLEFNAPDLQWLSKVRISELRWNGVAADRMHSRLRTSLNVPEGTVTKISFSENEAIQVRDIRLSSSQQGPLQTIRLDGLVPSQKIELGGFTNGHIGISSDLEVHVSLGETAPGSGVYLIEVDCDATLAGTAILVLDEWKETSGDVSPESMVMTVIHINLTGERILCTFRSSAYGDGELARLRDCEAFSYGQLQATTQFLLRPLAGQLLRNISGKTRPKSGNAYQAIPRTEQLHGESWISMTGDAISTRLFERSNVPLAVFGDALVLFHPNPKPTTPTTEVACAIEDGRLTSQAAPVPAESGRWHHLPGLCLGDLVLAPPGVLGSTVAQGAARFRTANHPGAPGDVGWKLEVAQLLKTAFKGDASLGGNGTRSEMERVGDRLEIYPALSGSGSKSIQFDLGGRWTGDLFSGFEPKDGSVVESRQPSNTYITFRRNTKVLFPQRQPLTEQSLWEMASATDSDSAPKYAAIDASLRFPPVRDHLGELVDVILEVQEEFDEAVANTAVAIDATGRRALAYLKAKGAQFPIGLGWGLAAPVLADDIEKLILKLNLKKNLGSLAKAAVQLSPDGWQCLTAQGNPLGAPQKVAARQWERMKRALTSQASPVMNDWAGLLIQQANLECLPSLELPELVKKLVQAVKVDLMWVDGRGVSAFAGIEPLAGNPCSSDEERYVLDMKTGSISKSKLETILSPVDDKEYDKAYAILADMEMVVQAGSMVVFGFTLLWTLPCFDRMIPEGGTPGDARPCRTVVTIKGSLTDQADGSQQISLSASLPEKLQTIELNWSFLKRIVVEKLEIIKSTSKGWDVLIDARPEFDLTGAEGGWDESGLADLRDLVLQGWRLNFDNPFDMKLPTLKLPEARDFKLPGGFRFPLRGIELGLKHQFKFLGALKLGSETLGFMDQFKGFEVPIHVNVQWSNLSDWPELTIDGLKFPDLKFDLFDLLEVKISKLDWNDTNGQRFEARAEVKTKWNPPTDFKAILIVGCDDATGENYWLIGLTSPTMDLGALSAKDPLVLIGSKVAYGELHDDLMNCNNVAVTKKLRALFGKGNPLLQLPAPINGVRSDDLDLTDWHYTRDFDWIIAISAEDADIGGSLSVERLLFVLCDNDAMRFDAELTVLGQKLAEFSASVDYRRRAVKASFAPRLPAIPFGAYQAQLERIGFEYGDGLAGFNTGDDPYGIKVLVDPPPAPVPFNTYRGGFGVRVERRPNEVVATFGIALKGSYENSIGSEGGAFGAYLAGSFGLGGIVRSDIRLGSQTSITLRGAFVFDAAARGGVSVLGCRWDVFRFNVHAAMMYQITVSPQSMSTNWGSTFTGSFEVCLSPCTCVGGEASFQQGMNESQATSYSPPSARLTVSKPVNLIGPAPGSEWLAVAIDGLRLN